VAWRGVCFCDEAEEEDGERSHGGYECAGPHPCTPRAGLRVVKLIKVTISLESGHFELILLKSRTPYRLLSSRTLPGLVYPPCFSVGFLPVPCSTPRTLPSRKAGHTQQQGRGGWLHGALLRWSSYVQLFLRKCQHNGKFLESLHRRAPPAIYPYLKTVALPPHAVAQICL
jgi:hypothetical protein